MPLAKISFSCSPVGFLPVGYTIRTMEQVPSVLSQLSLPPAQMTSALPVFQQIVSIVQRIGGSVMTAEERRALAVEALHKLAAGEDQVFGTEDDRLSPAVVAQIQSLIESKMLEDLVAHFQSLLQEAVPETVRANPFWKLFCCVRPAETPAPQ